MKMYNIKGELVNVDVRPSSYPIRGAHSRSKIQGLVGAIIEEEFPLVSVLEEFTVPGSRMKVDFFLPSLGILYEADGDQHSLYTPFFHGDRNSSKEFAEQKMRDRQKNEWAEINHFKLVRIKDGEPTDAIRSIIRDSIAHRRKS